MTPRRIYTPALRLPRLSTMKKPDPGFCKLGSALKTSYHQLCLEVSAATAVATATAIAAIAAIASVTTVKGICQQCSTEQSTAETKSTGS
jgi:hypothetical protein